VCRAREAGFAATPDRRIRDQERATMSNNPDRTMRIAVRNTVVIASALLSGILTLPSWSVWATVAQEPLTVARAVRPIVMLALSNDEQLYKYAYDDFTDIDNDGVLDLTYDNAYEYYGYFGPGLCYDYLGGQFVPTGQALNHQCSGYWSGNLLNWATMTRMDLLRRVLYGGKRSVDTAAGTVLERALIPPDMHAFAKVFAPSGGASDVALYTPYSSLAAITLCNVTDATTGESQSLDTAANPPLIKVATGRWPLWALGEASGGMADPPVLRLPCGWED
jgi:type IV pilus assembly protein PilY1